MSMPLSFARVSRVLRRAWNRRRAENAVRLALAALVLTGCKAVGPDYHGPPKPDTPDPAKYKNAGRGQPMEARRARR